MNVLLLSIFAIICVVAVESRYPYEDTYASGDIVPYGLNSRYPYDREGRYQRKIRRGGYSGIINRRNNRYGRDRDDDLQRDYRRRYMDSDYYLPPRGLGGYKNRHYDRPDYESVRNRRPQITGPPKYYDEDEFNYGGYNERPGYGVRHS